MAGKKRAARGQSRKAIPVCLNGDVTRMFASYGAAKSRKLVGCGFLAERPVFISLSDRTLMLTKFRSTFIGRHK